MVVSAAELARAIARARPRAPRSVAEPARRRHRRRAAGDRGLARRISAADAAAVGLDDEPRRTSATEGSPRSDGLARSGSRSRCS